MHDTPSARVGIVRPAHASQHPVVAEIEARVLRTELERRLGRVVLDLRVDGAAIGAWQPLAHAAWPAGIDVQLDAATLWAAGAPLTALAGRTIEPAAAEVRARMLVHLGVVPDGPYDLDAELLATLSSMHVRPTDLWLAARAAAAVATGDPSIDALATPPGAPAVAALDAALDALAATVTPPVESVAGLVTELAALRHRVRELEAELARTTAEAGEQLEQLSQQRAVLSERLERTQLDRAGTP